MWSLYFSPIYRWSSGQVISNLNVPGPRTMASLTIVKYERTEAAFLPLGKERFVMTLHLAG